MIMQGANRSRGIASGRRATRRREARRKPVSMTVSGIWRCQSWPSKRRSKRLRRQGVSGRWR